MRFLALVRFSPQSPSATGASKVVASLLSEGDWGLKSGRILTFSCSVITSLCSSMCVPSRGSQLLKHKIASGLMSDDKRGLNSEFGERYLLELVKVHQQVCVVGWWRG